MYLNKQNGRERERDSGREGEERARAGRAKCRGKNTRGEGAEVSIGYNVWKKLARRCLSFRECVFPLYRVYSNLQLLPDGKGREREREPADVYM